MVGHICDNARGKNSILTQKETVMNACSTPDIMFFVCGNCFPQGSSLPRQWHQDGVHVQTRHVPCSGKTDVQYMFHALESGAQGVAVVTCPKGDCRLAQGNYRAEVRIRTVRRLLSEIGMDPARVELLICSAEDNLEQLVRDSAQRFCALGKSELVDTYLEIMGERHDEREDAFTEADRFEWKNISSRDLATQKL